MTLHKKEVREAGYGIGAISFIGIAGRAHPVKSLRDFDKTLK